MSCLFYFAIRADDVSHFSKMLILSLIIPQEVTRASDDAAKVKNVTSVLVQKTVWEPVIIQFLNIDPWSRIRTSNLF